LEAVVQHPVGTAVSRTLVDVMRIAQVVSTFPPYMAGTGNVCYYNSLELARLGHDVTVFTSRYPDDEYDYPPSIRVVRSKPWFRIGNAPFLPGLAGIRQYDIVHLHYPFIFGAEMVLINSWLRHNTLVVTCHQDLIFNGFLGPFVAGYKTLLGNRALSRARKILAPSLDYIANSSFKRLVDTRGNDVAELPNGVDIERFNPAVDCTGVRSKYNLGGRSVVLFVGALDKAHYHRRVDVLMRAFSKLENQETILMITGEGDMQSGYRRLAADLGVADRVVFTGTILNWDLPQYYALCDLMVLPSTRLEIFGMVLVEAMACGKPVIGSNLPGVRTVVDDEVNGFLVEPGDVDELAAKMRRLLADKDLRQAFGQEARRKVEAQYDWRAIGQRLERIYQDVLGETAR
jgi:glycosyltransferase involved in cell wall biosynthesis